jgi:hypothetical protein
MTRRGARQPDVDAPVRGLRSGGLPFHLGRLLLIDGLPTVEIAVAAEKMRLFFHFRFRDGDGTRLPADGCGPVPDSTGSLGKPRPAGPTFQVDLELARLGDDRKRNAGYEIHRSCPSTALHRAATWC